MSQDMNFNFTEAWNAGLSTRSTKSKYNKHETDISIKFPGYPFWRDVTISNDTVLISLRHSGTYCQALEAWLKSNNIAYEVF